MNDRAIADTSLFIARESGRPLRAYEEDREIAVSIVTVAELETGCSRLASREPVPRAFPGLRTVRL